jgi:hypothetical protein
LSSCWIRSLSVNQASSIQSFGGTCESVTIGHNPFKLPLTANAIFLKQKRPLFWCERSLVEADVDQELQKDALSETSHSNKDKSMKDSLHNFFQEYVRPILSRREDLVLNTSKSHSFHDPSVRPRVKKYRSAAALLGAYTSMDEQRSVGNELNANDDLAVENIVEEAILDRRLSDKARNVFERFFDLDGDGFLSEDDFLEGAHKLKIRLSDDDLITLFKLYDRNDSNVLDYEEFLFLVQDTQLELDLKIPPMNRDERGMIQIEPSHEKYFGEAIRKINAGKSNKDIDWKTAKSQHFAQELYETRIASLQRFVAMTVMFHQMGKRVERFFARISFGLLSYRMDRTHSIMRIATTASPVSGADLKQQMRHLQLTKKVQHSVNVIAQAYLRYRERKKVADSNTVVDASKEE